MLMAVSTRVNKNLSQSSLDIYSPFAKSQKKKQNRALNVNTRDDFEKYSQKPDRRFCGMATLRCLGFHAGVELVISLLLGDEFVVRTLLYDASLLKDNYAITVLDG